MGELSLTLLDAGWGVACLDPRSCRLSSTVLESFGCQDVSYRSGTDDSFGTPGTVYNNTTSTDAVPDSSKLHPSFAKLSNGPGSAGAEALFEAQLLAQLLESDDEDIDEEDEGEEQENLTLHTIIPQDSSCKFVLDAEYSFVSFLRITVAIADMFSSQSIPMETDESLFVLKQEGLPTLQSSSALGKRQISTLPFHIFKSSKSDIRLMSDIRYGPFVKEGTTCNTVVCQQVLHQKIPPGLRHPGMERLNMVLQIPELGIIAIAYQAGRVALLTMTKKIKNDQFGFRLEWLLPFKTQEDAGKRPDVALLGMAIGPVQGCGKMSSSSIDEPRDSRGLVNGTRRFRLILTYYDHTILSYEIWRSIADSRSGTQDRILVL